MVSMGLGSLCFRAHARPCVVLSVGHNQKLLKAPGPDNSCMLFKFQCSVVILFHGVCVLRKLVHLRLNEILLWVQNSTADQLKLSMPFSDLFR